MYEGTSTEVSPVAYFATRQRRVRVEVPNPDGWPAGLPAWVRFTAPDGEWSERVVRFGEDGEIEAGPVSVAPGSGAPLAAAYADATFAGDRSVVRWTLDEGERTP